MILKHSQVNLRQTLDKIFGYNLFLVVALGDFNAKSDQLYENNKTTYVSSKIVNLTSQIGPK